MRSPGAAAGLLALLLLGSALPLPPATAQPCTGPSNVWFLGVIQDIEDPDSPRSDFKKDVGNFEAFLAALRTTYCIPEAQAKILAFRDYSAGGKSYETATEAATKGYLRSFGTAAGAQPDPLFFFFLSSHGIFYASSACGTGTRTLGSMSNLLSGGGDDGNLRDCELGVFLNTYWPASTRMFVFADCSFCGGFSDSITAVSGTVPDGSVPRPSGIVRPNRVVISGCAVTTECFGGSDGGVSYGHFREVLDDGVWACDGWTAPMFPQVQGIDAPVNSPLFHPEDGRCTASEWFFASVMRGYLPIDVIAIQQQYRIKYGFASLADDILII